MKTLLQFALLIFISSLFSSCAQIAGFQTAKVVGKNNAEVTVAMGGLGITDAFDLDATGVLPILQFGGRYGVSDDVDLGVTINTGSSVLFDAKFQLVGDEYSKFALALGPGLGFSGLGTFIMQSQFPVHMSIHPNDRFAFYFTPKYINQFAFQSNGSVHYLGGSIGIETGKNVKFGADVSYVNLLNTFDGDPDDFSALGVGLFHVGVGVKFMINGNRQN